MAIGGAAAVAGAEGGMTITPSSGPPGTSYDVDIKCGEMPAIKQHHTQDGYVQMTIAPYGPDDVSEVSPSLWRVTETAGTTDEEYFASCGDASASAGSGRFDAESPHLWFGPRVEHTPYQLVGKTTVEGTDCPAGTQAEVSIRSGDVDLQKTAVIDEYGDWSVELPAPVGDTTFAIDASCGSVTYERLQATTTSTSSSVPQIVDPTVTAPSTTTTTTTAPTPAAPATAQAGTADYTG